MVFNTQVNANDTLLERKKVLIEELKKEVNSDNPSSDRQIELMEELSKIETEQASTTRDLRILELERWEESLRLNKIEKTKERKRISEVKAKLKVEYDNKNAKQYFKELAGCKNQAKNIKCDYLKSIIKEKNEQYKKEAYATVDVEINYSRYDNECNRVYTEECSLLKLMKKEIIENQASEYVKNPASYKVASTFCEQKVKALKKLKDREGRKKVRASLVCKAVNSATLQFRRIKRKAEKQL